MQYAVLPLPVLLCPQTPPPHLWNAFPPLPSATHTCPLGQDAVPTGWCHPSCQCRLFPGVLESALWLSTATSAGAAAIGLSCNCVIGCDCSRCAKGRPYDKFVLSSSNDVRALLLRPKLEQQISGNPTCLLGSRLPPGDPRVEGGGQHGGGSLLIESRHAGCPFPERAPKWSVAGAAQGTVLFDPAPGQSLSWVCHCNRCSVRAKRKKKCSLLQWFQKL